MAPWLLHFCYTWPEGRARPTDVETVLMQVHSKVHLYDTADSKNQGFLKWLGQRIAFVLSHVAYVKMHPDRVAYRCSLLGDESKQKVRMLLGALSLVESGLLPEGATAAATPAPTPAPAAATEPITPAPSAVTSPPPPKRLRTSSQASVQVQRSTLLETIKLAKPSPVKAGSLAAAFGLPAKLVSTTTQPQLHDGATAVAPAAPMPAQAPTAPAEEPATAIQAGSCEIPDMFQETPSATLVPVHTPTQAQIPTMFLDVPELHLTPTKKAPTPVSSESSNKQERSSEQLFGLMGLQGGLDAQLSQATHKCSPRPSRAADVKKLLAQDSGNEPLRCNAGSSL